MRARCGRGPACLPTAIQHGMQCSMLSTTAACTRVCNAGGIGFSKNWRGFAIDQVKQLGALLRRRALMCAGACGRGSAQLRPASVRACLCCQEQRSALLRAAQQGVAQQQTLLLTRAALLPAGCAVMHALLPVHSPRGHRCV